MLVAFKFRRFVALRRRWVCFFRTSPLMSKPGSTSQEVLPLCKGAGCRLDAAGYVMTCFLLRYRGVKALTSIPLFAVSEQSKCLTDCLLHLQNSLTRLKALGILESALTLCTMGFIWIIYKNWAPISQKPRFSIKKNKWIAHLGECRLFVPRIIQSTWTACVAQMLGFDRHKNCGLHNSLNNCAI